jgi:hypothetical protein
LSLPGGWRFHYIARECYIYEVNDYLNKRKDFAHSIGQPDLFGYIDHWPLYAGVQNISRFLFIYEQLKSVAGIPGHIVELGSWKGANLLWLAKCQLFHNGSKKIHSFDSFEGLTEFTKFDNSAHLRDKYKGNEDQLRSMIELYNLEDIVFIHKGLIEQTVPEWSVGQSKISFIYFDADLYLAAKTTLEYLTPLLSIGGLILFDEYGASEWQGETQAVDEFLSKNSNYEVIKPKNCVQPTLMLRKIS